MTLLVLLLAACGPATVKVGTETNPDTTDTDTDTDTDADTDGDTDTDTDTDTDPTGVVSDVQVVVHDDVHTILVVSWNQSVSAESWVEYGFENDEWYETPHTNRGAGAAQASLLGIPADTAVTLRVHALTGAESVTGDYVGTTGSLPGELPLPTVDVWDPSQASSERWMLGSIDVGNDWYYGPYYAFILDRQGRYVWYWKVPEGRGALYVQPGWDGRHVFVDGNVQYVFDNVDASVFRLTLDLARADEIPLDYGFAIDEHVDGGILYESRASNQFHLNLMHPDGTEETLWDCTPYFRSIGANPGECNPNTIVWDPDRNTVMWSMYYVDTVLEIDLDSGEVLKQFGQLDGGWTFDPESATVDYQHYVNWTPDGTIIASTHAYGKRNEQRTREYEVDEANQTLHEIWTFGADVDHYAQYAGEAWRLPNRNTMVGYGVDGAELEVTPDGEVVWDVEWPTRPNTHLIGHMTMVDDLYALNGE